jgi:hypothetical protein
MIYTNTHNIGTNYKPMLCGSLFSKPKINEWGYDMCTPSIGGFQKVKN